MVVNKYLSISGPSFQYLKQKLSNSYNPYEEEREHPNSNLSQYGTTSERNTHRKVKYNHNNIAAFFFWLRIEHSPKQHN